MIGAGVLFWTTNGLVGAPEILPSAAQIWLQERAELLANPILDVLVILVLTGLFLAVWVKRRRTQQDERV